MPNETRQVDRRVDLQVCLDELASIREGVRGLARLVGVTDPDATCADVAAGIERVRVVLVADMERIGRLITELDKARGEATLWKHERDEALRQRAQVNLAAGEGARP